MAEPIRVEGLREFQRTLRRLEPEVEKELRRELKTAADKVATTAQQHARSFQRTGRYARSIKSKVTAKGASVGSRLPQAAVLHWGGTIRPRGVPITFPRRAVISEALDTQTNEILADVGEAIDRAARRAGW